MSGPAIPTSLDNLHAIKYAQDRIKREKCNSKEITKKFYSDQGVSDSEHLIWKNRDQNRVYPCPPNVPECEHGTCRIQSAELCYAVTQDPWVVDSDGVPQDFPTIPCQSDQDCASTSFPSQCSNNIANLKKNSKDNKPGNCVHKYPYLEWHPQEKDSLGRPIEGGGRCILGNSMFKKWCEYPAGRSTSSETGLTDAPPFRYDPSNGKCYITKDYCNFEEVEYEDCNDTRIIKSDSSPLGFEVTCAGEPDCYETSAQKAAEWFLGKTIFRGFKRFLDSNDPIHKALAKNAKDGKEIIANRWGLDDQTAQIFKLPDFPQTSPKPSVKPSSSKEFFEIGKKEFYKNSFETIDDEIDIIADRNQAEILTEIGPNFAGEGIHLYQISWPGEMDLKFGFLADEVGKHYKHLVYNKNGVDHIKINKSQIVDRNTKRIYVILGSGTWASKQFMQAMIHIIKHRAANEQD